MKRGAGSDRIWSSSSFVLQIMLKAYLPGTTLSHALAYGRPTTRIASCKSNLQLAYDSRARHKKCRRILKHVLKRSDKRSRNR